MSADLGAVELLLKHGAAPGVVDNDGLSPLHVACFDSRIVAMLQKAHDRAGMQCHGCGE
jgi:ankyrin repeat protein